MDILYTSRPSWNNYFMKLAWLIAERSTCLRHHVGTVIIKHNHILTTGYNGAATGIKDCTQLGCLRNQFNIASGERHEICRAIHAEQNAILQGAQHGVSITNSTMYCTHSPCILCAKLIVNVKIKKIFLGIKYKDNRYKKLFKQAGIKLHFLKIHEFSINQVF